MGAISEAWVPRALTREVLPGGALGSAGVPARRCHGSARGSAALLQALPRQRHFHPFPRNFLTRGEKHVIAPALPQLTVTELK